jgi:hypothetical protein
MDREIKNKKERVKMKNRTDVHCPSKIIPSDYEHVMFYNLSTTEDNWPVPSFRVNCNLDRAERDSFGNIVKMGKHDEDGKCCVVGLKNIARVKLASHGTTGKCTVCGTKFVYGEIWKHISTNEYIHIGHICSKKYGLLAEYAEFELQYNQYKKIRAMEIKKVKDKKDREAFLENYPGLEQALETDHDIVRNIKSRFLWSKYLSEKQISLVFKLQNEVNNPKIEEKYVSAPEGKQTFEGIVIKEKIQKWYGKQAVTKITVKVKTKDGVWLAWGTAPSGILDSTPIKGKTVCITATLKRSDRDEHFAFFKRPKGEIVNMKK